MGELFCLVGAIHTCDVVGVDDSHDEFHHIASDPDTNQRTNLLCLSIVDTNDITGVNYSDQTGQFPHLSSRGSRYLFVLYNCNYDANAILVEPLKNKTATTQ